MSPSPASTQRSNVLGYLFSGGLAAAANYGSRFLFSLWLPFELAVSAAYLVGMICGFLLMRRLAFTPSKNGVKSQVIGYVAVNALAVLQTVGISSLLVRGVLPALGLPGNHEAIAHAIGVAVPVITSYFGHRHLTFR